METLRFAPIIRVSTEQQDFKGESLKTQRTQIIQYVNSLKGTIPDYCWQYSGQEHATTDQERNRLNKLLKDSSNGLFDAVIVCDASRWSRDNLKNKEGLNILRSNGIRFFVGTMEYDLYNPEHNFYLGMAAEIGELQARQQKLKSINSRIHRTKRGIPSAGKLPYGRIWDKKNEKWIVDLDKKRIIQDTAKRYLSGEGIRDIAKSLNVDASTLFKTLTQRCGTEWECKFEYKDANIKETIKMTIPRLLDQKTIDAIHEKMRNNITYERGNKKYSFLLQGMIFCKCCGFKMYTFRNRYGHRYYRHSSYSKDCGLHKFLPADKIENAVLMKLVQTFGDRELIEKSIQKATPDLDKIEVLSKEVDNLRKELKRVLGGKDKIIDSVADGLLSKEEVKSKIEDLRSRESTINSRLALIEAELTIIPM